MSLSALRASCDRRRRRWLGWPLLRFAGIGTAATVLQLLLFALLSQFTSTTTANVIAWVVSTLAANLGQRGVVFGVTRAEGLGRDLAFSTVTSLVGLLLSAELLATLGTDSTWIGLAVLIGVNTVVGTGRYLVMRRWFSHRGAARPAR